MYLYFTQSNQYDSWLRVSNLSDYTSKTNKNKDAIDYMEYDLHKTVLMNLRGDLKTNGVKDFVVREGTFSEESDGNGIYTVEFITDSETLKQSYAIFYQWVDSTDEEVVSNLSSEMQHWRTAVNCLPESKLIYDDFHCVDMNTELSNNTGPTISISNWGIEDSVGNSLSSQIEIYEQYFIEYQILGDYLSNNDIDRLNIAAAIVDQPRREVVNGNTLEFTIEIDSTSYIVKVDYDKNRLIQISKPKSGLVVERAS